MKNYKKILSFLFSLLAWAGSFGQNLIPNGDFELGATVSTAQWMFPVQYNCDVDLYDTLQGLDYWTVTTGEPHRFVYGSPFFNCYDNIISHSGTAHILFNWNDGGKTTLIQPLQTGHKYKLHYFLSVDTMWWNYYQDTTWVIFQFNNGGNVFNSPNFGNFGFGIWHEYDTIFVAMANSTEIEFHGNYVSGTCVYMDDISLQEDTSFNIEENSTVAMQPSIIFNSANNTFLIHFNNHTLNTIIIYNSSGQCIFHVCIKSESLEIPLLIQSSGIYHISILSNNKLFSKSIFIN